MSTAGGGLGSQGLVDPVGDTPLQAPERVGFGPSLGELALVVGTAFRISGALVKAMSCRIRLSWRLPPRLRRWRLVRPELAGSGAVPLLMANWPWSHSG
jgi:hypothetical protein